MPVYSRVGTLVLYSLLSYSSTRPILPGATVAGEFHMSVQGVFPQVLQGGDRPQIPRETGVGWPENPFGVTRNSTLDRGTLSFLDGGNLGSNFPIINPPCPQQTIS